MYNEVMKCSECNRESEPQLKADLIPFTMPPRFGYSAICRHCGAVLPLDDETRQRIAALQVGPGPRK